MIFSPTELSGLIREKKYLIWLHKVETLTLYTLTLELQAELAASKVQAYLSSLPCWREAKSILDVGCGPGTFYGNIQNLLDGKTYTGIDSEPKFIERAIKKFGNSTDHKFESTNLYSHHLGNFDLVIMVQVLQHLPNIEGALEHLSKLLVPLGYLVICDTNGSEEYLAHPETPIFKKLWEEIETKGHQGGRNKDCLSNVKNIAVNHDFKICEIKNMDENVSPDQKASFFHYIMAVSELTKRLYKTDIPQMDLMDQLGAWEQNPESTATIRNNQWVVIQKRT